MCGWCESSVSEWVPWPIPTTSEAPAAVPHPRSDGVSPTTATLAARGTPVRRMDSNTRSGAGRPLATSSEATIASPSRPATSRTRRAVFREKPVVKATRTPAACRSLISSAAPGNAGAAPDSTSRSIAFSKELASSSAVAAVPERPHSRASCITASLFTPIRGLIQAESSPSPCSAATDRKARSTNPMSCTVVPAMSKTTSSIEVESVTGTLLGIFRPASVHDGALLEMVSIRHVLGGVSRQYVAMHGQPVIRPSGFRTGRTGDPGRRWPAPGGDCR